MKTTKRTATNGQRGDRETKTAEREPGGYVVIDAGRVVYQGDGICEGLAFITGYGGGVLCKLLCGPFSAAAPVGELVTEARKLRADQCRIDQASVLPAPHKRAAVGKTKRTAARA